MTSNILVCDNKSQNNLVLDIEDTDQGFQEDIFDIFGNFTIININSTQIIHHETTPTMDQNGEENIVPNWANITDTMYQVIILSVAGVICYSIIVWVYQKCMAKHFKSQNTLTALQATQSNLTITTTIHTECNNKHAHQATSDAPQNVCQLHHMVPPLTPQINSNKIKTPDNQIGLQIHNNIEFSRWLERRVQLPQYFELLIKNGYESLDMIKTIKNRHELNAIGITLREHQTKLLVAIETLRYQTNDMTNQNQEDTKIYRRSRESTSSERMYGYDAENTMDITPGIANMISDLSAEIGPPSGGIVRKPSIIE